MYRCRTMVFIRSKILEYRGGVAKEVINKRVSHFTWTFASRLKMIRSFERPFLPMTVYFRLDPKTSSLSSSWWWSCYCCAFLVIFFATHFRNTFWWAFLLNTLLEHLSSWINSSSINQWHSLIVQNKISFWRTFHWEEEQPAKSNHDESRTT